jgi:hypothetical protein
MNLNDFTDYCRSFYDANRPDAVYPFASEAEIRAAVLAHMTDPEPPIPFTGDSIDREAVRDRVLAIRGVTGSGETDFDLAVREVGLLRSIHGCGTEFIKP